MEQLKQGADETVYEFKERLYRQSKYLQQLPSQLLNTLHLDLCSKAKQIMAAKNNDYSYGNDPYNNFRGSTLFHVEPEIGILLRMSDKMKRIETFVNSNYLKVKEESVIDSCVDIINYAVLVAGLLMERIEKEQDSKE